MLVLSRLPGESIMIADNIEVTIIGIEGNKVKLGIAAPSSVPVHRLEIYERIRRERGETDPAGNAMQPHV
jgi:carbon storage regulator